MHWIAAFLLGACSRSPERDAERPGATPTRDLVVFAASSLVEAFSDVRGAFCRRHNDVRVTLSFAGSQELRTQLIHGARADVVATADEQTMQDLLNEGLLDGKAEIFAENEPVVAVSKAWSSVIRSFEDLPKATRIVLADDEVPIGRYTASILSRFDARHAPGFRDAVLRHVVSRELNVRQTLVKVVLEEADAAIVYRTDALAATRPLTVVSIPDDVNVAVRYPIAVLRESHAKDLARSWVSFVRSSDGEDVLVARGFRRARVEPERGP